MKSRALPCLVSASVFALLTPSLSAAEAQVPDAIAAKGETMVVTLHAVGAQIYECKIDTAGKLVWQFREPIAALFLSGKTVGRHYAGPSWDLADGSGLTGKAAGRAPAPDAQDIPWLKLDVTAERGAGQLSGVTTIQRINTKGGNAEGSCQTSGTFLSVPYSADYAFFKKAK